MSEDCSSMNLTTPEEHSEDQHDGPQVSLTLRAVDGRESSLKVPYTIRISALKNIVALAFSEAVDRVRLIYRGKRLNPDECLSSYIPKTDAHELHCIHVVFRSTPAVQEPSQTTSEEPSTSRLDAQNGLSGGNSSSATMHSVPGSVSLNALRLGPSTQLSFTTSSSLPGLLQTDLMSGPAIFQSLISSLGQTATGASSTELHSGSAGRATSAATAAAVSGTRSSPESATATLASQTAPEGLPGTPRQVVLDRTLTDDVEISTALPRSSAANSTPATSSLHEPPASTGGSNNVLRDTSESGGADSHPSRPQQLRVTVGSLPISLGSGGLGQLFQTVLGQLASPALQRQNGSRSRRVSSRQRTASLFPEYPVRGVQTHQTEPSETDTRGDSDSRLTTETNLPPGLTAFLRRTVNILGQSRRGVTRASESILESLEDALTQTSRQGSGRHHPSGIVTMPQRESSGRRLESVWVSNECVSEELAWDSLTQLAQVIRRATGWEFPDLAQENSSTRTSLSLARFLLSHQQLNSLCCAVLSQIEAWQRGTGRLRVADIGHAIEMLALSSSIQANLASLFSWLFLHLSRHVDPAMLYERMHWDAFSSDQHGTTRTEEEEGFFASHESTSHEAVAGPTIQETTRDAHAPPVMDMPCESSRLSAGAYRKRSMDEEPTETLAPSLETHLDDASLVKKQKTTNSCEKSLDCDDLSASDVEPPCLEVSSQSSQRTGQSRLDSILATCPKVLQTRFRRWVANPESFSKAVLAQARVRPPSTAYSLNHLDSREKNPGQLVHLLFKLCWNQTASRCNTSTDLSVPEHLSHAYVALVLREVVELAQNNPDYQQESYRFPYIEKAARLLDSLRREHPE